MRILLLALGLAALVGCRLTFEDTGPLADDTAVSTVAGSVACDEGPAPTPSTWYADADGDGYGDPDAPTHRACTAPDGHVADATDCDDTDPDQQTPAEWWVDCDGDGSYAGTPVASCGVPTGACPNGADPHDSTTDAPTTVDCNDDPTAGGADATPGQELEAAHVEDGLDNDCSGGEECFEDADGDGFGTGNIIDDDGDGICDDPGESAVDTDCDDDPSTGPNTFPGAAPEDGPACMRDDDGDGWGDDSATGAVTAGTDCNDDPDDGGADIHPGVTIDATAVTNGVDDDCDGFRECYLDADDDGAGTDEGTVVDTASNDDCSDPFHSATATDCDDTDPTGTTVETWWIDCDGDGVHALHPVSACGNLGTCPGDADPDTATTTEPSVFDCHDDDAGDPYCTDCQELYTVEDDLFDGTYWIDGDGSADLDGDLTTGDPFPVECDFVPSGPNAGGWIVLEWTDDSGDTDGNELIVIGSAGTGNPWHKCDDEVVERFEDAGFTSDTQPDRDGRTLTASLIYSAPGEAPYDWDEEVQALLGLDLELWVDDGIQGIPTNHLVAIVSDDEGHELENTPVDADILSGHEVYACASTTLCGPNTGKLLTKGENGECGGPDEAEDGCDDEDNDWPVCGTSSTAWHYHTAGSENYVEGQAGSPAPSIQGSGLGKDYVLPAQVHIWNESGGGAAVGWQYDRIRVR